MEEEVEFTKKDVELMLRCINATIVTVASSMVMSEMLGTKEQDNTIMINDLKTLFAKFKKVCALEQETPKKEKIKTIIVSLGNQSIN